MSKGSGFGPMFIKKETPSLPLAVLDYAVDHMMDFLVEAANLSKDGSLQTDDVKTLLGMDMNEAPTIRVGFFNGPNFQELPPKDHPNRKMMPKTLPAGELPPDFMIEMEIGTGVDDKKAAINYADALGENKNVTAVTGVRLDDNFKEGGKPTICVTGVTSILNLAQFMATKEKGADIDKDNNVVGVQEDVAPKISMGAEPKLNISAAPKSSMLSDILEEKRPKAKPMATKPQQPRMRRAQRMAEKVEKKPLTEPKKSAGSYVKDEEVREETRNSTRDGGIV